MAKLQFQSNIPIELQLKYPTGKHVPGQWGEQVMFSLTDGRVMYVPVIVEKQFLALQVRPGQPIEICKHQANGKTEWKVKLIEPAKTAPKPMAHANGHAQGAVQLLNQAESLDLPDVDPPHSQLEHALKIALDAAKKAEEYGQKIGKPIQFDTSDIRTMANSLLMNNRGRAA